MFSKSLINSSLFAMTIILLSLLPNNFLQTSYAQQQQANVSVCNPSACGAIRNISYPFRLKDDPSYCGDSRYELVCENNKSNPLIYLQSREFNVLAIDYENFSIRVADATIKVNNNCSFPQYSIPENIFSHRDSFYLRPRINTAITLVTCPYPMNHSVFVETTRCFNASNTTHAYLKAGHLNASYLGKMCKTELIVYRTSLHFEDENNVSLSDIHRSLLYGFELSWYRVLCGKCRNGDCYLSADNIIKCDRGCGGFMLPVDCGKSGAFNWLLIVLDYIAYLVYMSLHYSIVASIGIRIVIGVPCVLGFLLYKYKRRHLSMFDVIESFLTRHNNLVPIRYSYSEIKKMTRNFQEKLGNGGYGSVYKGKLRSGCDVAIKTLNNHRGNGQDFINEVATIGRIHHINVIKLIGYYAEGSSKCGLVYDFMPNGSLDKYIFDQEKSNSLSWEKKYEIVVGVAQGIEYLHRGCNIQILHFDIKPHNILLDDNFTPKISDFGLAKFYSTEKSIVTLTAARGTIGYVAPELINRSIGGVSYKADVYSFRMLLMELLGLKINLDANSNNSSQYFPHWIYDRFNKGKDIEIGNADDERTRKITRKLAIIALWCTQMSPKNRPSMNKVVEMLEGEDELLQIPHQPSQSPQTMVQNQDMASETYGSNDSTALLDDHVFDDL